MGKPHRGIAVVSLRVITRFIAGLWGAWTVLMVFAKEGTYQRCLFTGFFRIRVNTLAPCQRFF